MREYLFRGKRISNGEWINGILFNAKEHWYIIPHGNEYDFDPVEGLAFDVYGCEVDPKTVGQFTGITDVNDTKVFEGDVIKYMSFMGDIECNSEVKIGRYIQDGSRGEYQGVECYGVYAEILHDKKPNWLLEFEEIHIDDYENTMSLLEIGKFEIIGNIYDKPELLKGGDSD